MNPKIYLLLLWALSSNLFSEPLLVVNSNHWQADFKIFVANCSMVSTFPRAIYLRQNNFEFVDLIYVGAPRIKYPKGSYAELENFCTQYQNRRSVLYGLASYGGSEAGCLYQLDGNTGEIIESERLDLAVKTGYLGVSDMYYGNQWHTLLIVIVNGFDHVHNQIKIYDITHPSHPFRNPYFASTNIHRVITRPIPLRLRGRYGFILSGGSHNREMLQILFMDNLELMGPWLFEQSPSLITAVDLYHRGEVDRIYALNSRGLWAIDVSSTLIQPPQKLYDIRGLSLPLAIKDPSGLGLKIYFAGEEENVEGIYEIHDPLMNNQRGRGKLIERGQFVNPYLYSGKLVLVPKNPSAVPRIIKVPSLQQSLAVSLDLITWGNVVEDTESSPLSNFRIANRLLWDTSSEKEALLTLNDSCQLKMLHPSVKLSEMGLLAWRKLTNRQLLLFSEE